jgi:hypothetical protein
MQLNGKEETMPRTFAWHSIKEPHHHENTRCGPGSEIPAHNRVSGTGGKPLCKNCARLNSEGK